MGDRSTIEWTEATWNPVTGCTKVSAGCDNCYAETFAERWRGIPGHPYEQGFDLRFWPERLDQPLRWKRPRVIFVNSMSDLFHQRVPASYVDRVLDTIRATPHHTYQVLTKRPGKMASVMRQLQPEPLDNLWLGTSVEDDDHVSRVDHVRATPAAVRFLSLEPLLGPVPSLALTGIDWVIVGGESGPGHRPIDAGWVRDIRDRCNDAGVAFFFKQWGGVRPKSGGRALDGRTWDEMPNAAVAEPAAV
ncbi:MAG: phage Gp37/Gp68 family protein [Egibacteraceae bacterium]